MAIPLGSVDASTRSSATLQGSNDFPYIAQIRDLRSAYPALKPLLDKLGPKQNQGREHVNDYYDKQHRSPGRCTLLRFEEQTVKAHAFMKPEDLDEYLKGKPGGKSNTECRLWVLEDLHVKWVDVLGKHLGVNPTVFSEQINTWHYTDSNSVPTRSLPSMIRVQKAFTLRYYEVRRLKGDQSISIMTNQMTFAANRRRYESWRDVDTDSRLKMKRPRHGLVRRCASFWSDQQESRPGWDGGSNAVYTKRFADSRTAVMLVDPAFDSCKWEGKWEGQDFEAACNILKDQTKHKDWPSLWQTRAQDKLEPTPDTSLPYHEGPSTLADASLASNPEVDWYDTSRYEGTRNRSSPLDEMVFYWTNVARQELITDARKKSVNSAYYLLKYIATCWNDQLELIACGVAESEYFADEHQASIEVEKTGQDWRNELSKIDKTTQEFNYQKRQLGYFEQALVLNLERLGLIIGHENIRGLESDDTALAIRDAQMDFLNIKNRLSRYSERVASLGNVANELASLHTAYRSINSGEYGLRLSLLASVVFPMTLITSMLSMGDHYLPGKRDFWVFFAASIPLVGLLAATLKYGRKPQRWLQKSIDKAREHRKNRGFGHEKPKIEC